MFRYLSTLVLLAVATPLFAQSGSSQEVRKSQTSGIEYYTTNVGMFGLDASHAKGGFTYPRGPNGISYMFGSGLWFGARKNIDISPYDSVLIASFDLSFVTYEPNSGSSWGTPGGWSNMSVSGSSALDLIAYAPEYDRADGHYTGVGVERPAWPLWTSDESPVTMAHPGRYLTDSAERVPAVSGSPAFVDGVAEQFTSRFHDGHLDAYGAEAETAHAIGLQIEQNTYSFSAPGLDNSVILHYSIINVSGDTLRDCYAGKMVDPDLGVPTNDRAAFYAARPELASGVVWSEGESAKTPGTLLITMLESPAVDARGFIRHDRRDYDSSEQSGARTFQVSGLEENPAGQAERYDFMAMGELDGVTDPGDKRTLLATGAFTMLPGDTARFAVALTVLADLIDYAGGADARIESAADRMISLYRAGSTSAVPSRPVLSAPLSIGRIHPNPATSSATIDLHLDRPADATVRIADALGRIVQSRESGTMAAGDHTMRLDLQGMAPGVYVVTVESGGTVRSQMVVVR